jgi:hypothetical protein
MGLNKFGYVCDFGRLNILTFGFIFIHTVNIFSDG